MRFIANIESKEIHDFWESGEKCNLDDLKPEHRRTIERKELIRLLREEAYDLCDWCFGPNRSPG